MSVFIDLFEIIGENVEMGGFCDHNYREWEINVAEAELNDRGYRIIRWETGERDSFGPLSRIVTVENEDGLRYKLIYH